MSSTEQETMQGIEKLVSDDVYEAAQTSSNGLEASQVQKRQELYGLNRLNEVKGEPVWLKFIKNFTSMMALLLWAGGAVAFFSGTIELGIAIWLVNVINGLFSFFQEYRASQATEALKKMLPSYARVIRDGKESKILAEELVPGDVMLIEEGDAISADGRIIFSTDLQVNQSALTGESNPVRKNNYPVLDSDTENLEFKNMVFAGTSVSNGSAKVVVTKIAMATEFGKIADLTQSMEDEKSPLQKELDLLTKQISLIAVTIGIFFLLASVFFVKQPLAQAFIFSLGMIVAFIPEGLLPTVTLSLAMAVQRMAKEHALVKKLSSVETLGATSVICSDKTGTLTQNEMTVNHVWTLNHEYEVTGQGYASDGHLERNNQEVTVANEEGLEFLLRAAALCSNARVLAPSDENPRYREAILAANDDYARQGLRVLAVAYRNLEEVADLPKALSDYSPEVIEEDMVFQGLVVMADPPREEVAAAVDLCRKASIRIVMVTGDYGLTAVSIAKRIGIVQGENPRVVTGLELKDMSDDDLKQALSDEVVFARVAPEQKYRVVTNLQALGHVVAVTGDGVNDAPALKKADIGVAMGITGTDVAKESADMILTDDNFASIVRAVEEGRAVYTNIRKFLTYIFNSNTSEAVPSAAFLFSKGGIPLPLTVMQILAIDLGTDMIPALGLGVEEAEDGIMERPPRRPTDRLLNKGLLIKAFIWYGLLEAAIAMGAFFFTYAIGGGLSGHLASSGQLYQQATTMTLGAIIFCQLGIVMNTRTEKASIFKVKLFSNKVINFGMMFEIFLFCLLAYLPFLHGLFNTAAIGVWHWLYLILCPILVLFIEEARKAYMRRKH
ncbi:cation-transporting P-type ATPase [Streptococcus mutans]|nr:cation-transporting P-type ATPase [Streptococcus mutans]